MGIAPKCTHKQKRYYVFSVLLKINNVIFFFCYYLVCSHRSLSLWGCRHMFQHHALYDENDISEGFILRQVLRKSQVLFGDT